MYYYDIPVNDLCQMENFLNRKKKETYPHTCYLTEDQLRARTKNEAAALLRQTHEIGNDGSNALSEHETKAFLDAIYKRAREKILILP